MTPERDIERIESKLDGLIQDVAVLKAAEARRSHTESRQPTLTLSVIMAIVALLSMLINVYPLLVARP